MINFMNLNRHCPLATLAALMVMALMVSTPAFADEPAPSRTIRANVQMKPGGPQEPADVPIYEAPIDVPNLDAAIQELDGDELVLGVFVDGEAVAYPVRFLSTYEVVNGRVGKLPVAPSW